MSQNDLMRLIEHASEFCQAAFARQGEIAPMWHAVTARGEEKITEHPQQLGKDLASALIRAWFELEDVVRYVYIGEAWTVEQRGMSEADNESVMALARQQRLEKHADAVEVVQLQGEDRDCGQVVAVMRIERPAGRKPYLGKLKIVIAPGDGFSSEGRMIGMLPVRGTKQ